MGLLDMLKRRGAGAGSDPAMEAIAAAVAENLRALGLVVDSKKYGTDFWEIAASTSPKMITTPGSLEASGVALLLAGKFDPPTLVLEEINSLQRGLGRRMVGAVIAGLASRPGVFPRVKVDDLSPFMADGRRWWEHVANEHSDFDWRITHGENLPPPGPPEGLAPPARPDIAQTPDFIVKRRKLEALAREFGYDPRKVTLSAEKETIDYLGQRFTSEGDARPDGAVTIFYDPEMSDARMGCCLAHELQHVKYFAVRDAFRGEPADGPLHRRFARFTPELLAARRGVSDYSNEHWDAWNGASPPRLFSMELDQGESEPIAETIAEVAKAFYNWGPDVGIDPVWKELTRAVNEEYEKLGR